MFIELQDRLALVPIQAPVQELDVLGLRCVVPLLRLTKRLNSLPAGEVIRMVGDDRGLAQEVPAVCRSRGDEILEHWEEAGRQVFLIRKG
jgi:tRNA 2-thiouridine synthesizing protein A